jgi:hypothetical protein
LLFGRRGGFLRLEGSLLAFEIAEAAFTFDGFVVLSAHINLYFGFQFRFGEVTMIIRRARFNFYFSLAGLVAVVGAGCQSPESKEKPRSSRQESFIRVHLEVTDGRLEHAVVPIYRAAPLHLMVERSPFLTELNVADARIIEGQGGFAVLVQFEQKGTWLLETYSATNPRRKFAIFAQWGRKGEFTRWLAAPIITQRISDGVLSFTPDASREECEEIVWGLRNVARKEGNRPKEESKEPRKTTQ